MWKRVLALALMLILLVLPLAARWTRFYEHFGASQFLRQAPGRLNVPLEEREIPRPDLDAVEAPIPEMAPFVDRYMSLTPGTILVDVAHQNRFEMSELSVLRARLSARGQRLEPVETTDDMAERLRSAEALIIISPGEAFAFDEIRQIKTFVDKGGRLLLVTDPTRFGLHFDDFGGLVGLDSDVIHINDLAAQFGLVFQSDYLYNTVENEGNFRNIKLTNLAENTLTEGVEQVVFYAAHSIVSEELALVRADGKTRSSNSERVEELTVAIVAAEEAVLALGDLTFMVEPQNAVYDNDRFIANIADFLSGGQRRYELSDFPFFFGDEVDLVYADDPLLDSDLLTEGGDLQEFFEERGKELTLREERDSDHDALFLGLYNHTEEVDAYLEVAGVTLWVTSTQRLEGKVVPEAELETTPSVTTTVTPTTTVSLSPTQPLTSTLEVTPTVEVTSTVEVTVTADVTATVQVTVTTEVTFTAEVTATAVVSPTGVQRVEIASLGEMVVTGTALLILQADGEHDVLVVLANTEPGLESTVERLTKNDLEDCLVREVVTFTTLAMCPTGEVASGEGDGGWLGAEPAPAPFATPTPSTTLPITDTIEPLEPVGEPEGRIIVVAYDEGEGRYDNMTSAEDYEAILDERFEVTVWSKARDGSPDVQEMLDYDLIVWTMGDFEGAVSDEESEALFDILLEGIPLLVSGAYFDDTATNAVQRDIQVEDASHPIARGFDPGQVIQFVPAPSGSEYETNVLEIDLAEEGISVFVRGPDSEAAGAHSVLVIEDEFVGLKMAFIGFPLYLLPEDAKTQLVLNAVDWMLAGGE